MMKSSKLDIQQYNVDDPFCENINDPILEANVKPCKYCCN